jgi:hypothetical protein
MGQITLEKQESGFFNLSFTHEGFSAPALLYHTHLLEPFAQGLANFPTSLGQVVEFKQEPDTPHEDIIHINVSCIDGSGHVAVELFIERTAYLSGNFKKNSVRLHLATEPVHLSRFSSQLLKALKNERDSATLCSR